MAKKKKEQQYALVYLTEHNGEVEYSQNFMIKLTKRFADDDHGYYHPDPIMKKVRQVLKKWHGNPDKRTEQEIEDDVFCFGDSIVEFDRYLVISQQEKNILESLNLVFVL